MPGKITTPFLRWSHKAVSFTALLVSTRCQKAAFAFLSLVSPLPGNLICMRSETILLAHPLRKQWRTERLALSGDCQRLNQNFSLQSRVVRMDLVQFFGFVLFCFFPLPGRLVSVPHALFF